MNKLFELKNILSKILKLNRIETCTIEYVEMYINELGTPKDLFERSYYQYKCQKKQYGGSTIYASLTFLMNFISFVMIIVLLLTPKFVFSISKGVNRGKYDAVCIFCRNLSDRIPNTIRDQFKELEFAENKKMLLTCKEKLFILRIWRRYPFSCNFVLKNLLKVGIYRYYIDNSAVDVQAVISSCEYSYTSSILTAYCREMNAEHINIMHGEILVELSKTFFAFDKFYVWDKYYADLCITKMAAEPKQFCVEAPPCLKFSEESNNSKKVNYKYYFQSHDTEQLLHVKKIMDALGCRYMVRPHPLYTDLGEVQQIFEHDKIENLNVPIETSIMEAEKVIAWDSTVLLQAYLNGQEAIIDDITNLERYKYSCDAGYIMTGKGQTLSKIIKVNRMFKE